MRKMLKYVMKESQYYPTPQKLVKDIIRKIDFNDMEEINFLEPCAGDGSICRVVKRYVSESRFNPSIRINCIEIEKVLHDSLKGQGFNVIASDFETFNNFPFYDLIVMNPPFLKGAKFLLKAYDLLNGNGRLVCILNAETIKNPHTKERQLLKSLIERTGEVEFIENAFSKAKRQTDINIAVVYLSKPLYENEFDIFGNIQNNILTEDEKTFDQLKAKVTGSELMSFDKVENAIAMYRNCVTQIFKGIDTLNKVKNSLIYLQEEAEEFNIETKEFIQIMLENDQEKAKEKSIKSIRKMIWSFIIKRCKMDQYLFYKQRQDFYNKIDKGASDLPFTKENIQQFFDNIFYQRNELFKEGIKDLFEEITSHHNGNNFHREGWKTNKNWKINKKIIVRYGIKYDWDRFSTTYSREWLDDLDKIVRKIREFGIDDFTIKECLSRKFQQINPVYTGEKFDNTCETPYFHLRFFKKGTLHITFKDKKLLDELNLIGAKLRTDLGYDDYGKKTA